MRRVKPTNRTLSPRRLFGVAAFGVLLLSTSSCGVSLPEPITEPLRGYVHNSYRRSDPVAEALRLGYRGLEVDLFLREGELRVGHGEKELRPGRSMRSMYLDPLRAHLATGASLRIDGEPFVINVDFKEADLEAYRTLSRVLADYEDLITRVEDGIEVRRAIDVVLVGWIPAPEHLPSSTRWMAVHARWPHAPHDHASRPAHELRLFSARYDRLLRWRGDGRLPDDDRRRLHDYVATAHAVPGRLCRVHGAPRNARVYRELLSAGVDLIGAKNPQRSAGLLARAVGAR